MKICPTLQTKTISNNLNAKRAVLFWVLSLPVLMSLNGGPLGASSDSAGVSLLLPGGARAGALAEAYSAAEGDIAAMKYNPASLTSLRRHQVTFFHQKGISEDAAGQLLVGLKRENAGWGLGIGYYDGGDLVLQDGINAGRDVKAQSDLSASLGYAHRFHRTSMGGSIRYLSSKLLDRYSANAFMADLGLHHELSSRVGLGLSAQNLGSGLTYLNKSERLPRIVRAGASFRVWDRATGLSVFTEAPYFMNESELRGAFGAELNVGPLDVRGGFMTGKNDQRFSVGAGFRTNHFSFDYAMGVMDALDNRHLATVSLYFGPSEKESVSYSAKPAVVETPVYTVQPADNQSEKIGAKEVFEAPAAEPAPRRKPRAAAARKSTRGAKAKPSIKSLR